jgi:hypothetical protein
VAILLCGRLKIGSKFSDSCSAIFVDAYYHSDPHIEGEKTIATTWHKFYLGIKSPSDMADTYAIFSELPKLLKRPGELSFELDRGVPDWVRNELASPLIVGVLFREMKIY